MVDEAFGDRMVFAELAAIEAEGLVSIGAVDRSELRPWEFHLGIEGCAFLPRVDDLSSGCIGPFCIRTDVICAGPV